jgi:hypothetical protein
MAPSRPSSTQAGSRLNSRWISGPGPQLVQGLGLEAQPVQDDNLGQGAIGSRYLRLLLQESIYDLGHTQLVQAMHLACRNAGFDQRRRADHHRLVLGLIINHFRHHPAPNRWMMPEQLAYKTLPEQLRSRGVTNRKGCCGCGIIACGAERLSWGGSY